MKVVFKFLMLSLSALVLTASIAIADTMPGKVGSQQEAESVLEMRSEFMKGLGSSMKAFSNFLKRGDGEPLELSGMAAQIAEDADSIPGLFPEDTGLSRLEESESKSEIWTNWNDFVSAANALVEPARAVEAAFDSGDPQAIGAAVKTLGGEGCKNCHKQFREKKN